MLITGKEVVKYGPVDNNFTPSLVEDFIEDAEYEHIKPFLGEDYFDELVNNASGDASTNLASHNKTFWEKHLRRITAFAVLYEAAPFVAIRWTSKGMMKNRSQTADSVSSSDAKYMRQVLESKFRQKMDTAHEFLTHEDNADNYPKYKWNQDDNCDTESNDLRDDLGIVFD